MKLTTFAPATAALSPLPVAWSDLQSTYTAPENPNVFVSCPDGPTGPSLAYSDGTVWRIFAKGIQTMSKMADTSGTATFTFSPTFSSSPLVFVETYDTSTDTLAITQKITALSSSSVTIKVRRQQLLPSVLTLVGSLVNFDTFGGTNLNLIQVGILVVPPPTTS